MIILPGYQISTQIHQSKNSLVYRGIRVADKESVIIKILKEEYPTPTQLTRYKQEYKLTDNLDFPRIITTYDLITYQNTLAIIFEDFDAESLKIITQQEKLTLKELLQISIKICEGLSQLHNVNIIHKDINPANIVYNSKTKQLKIIDLGISTQLNQEIQTLKNPNLLEGTLAYISPEQTGRVNRPIDSRSDLYSLGVTFYELLTGQLPFITEDSLELIHCHLAKQPIPPHKINPSLPQVISDLVMKLMAKNPELGYQSAWGIKADLENCLQQLENTGVIESFTLATQDIVERFSIPQKLYGRKREIETLLASFKRTTTAQKLKTELVLVSGYSGIGKSALVKEIYQPITEKKGYFTSGKFDQYQKNIPYYAIIQAFTQLIEQLLTESEARLKQWQDKLQTALKVNGQVIIDVIPELELIIGKQPDIPELAAQEAQNRFNLVFQDFVRVFCQAEHPLVLFLDDLQWADLASLKLMQLLVTASDINNLLVIGAYRDNEVNEVHPLKSTIKEIAKNEISINEIVLTSLSLENINLLISDTLNCSELKSQDLAALLKAKTNGNPFFMKEFFKSLYEEKLIQFDSSQNNWQWNISQIQARQITDNVVELMAGKIQKLPSKTQEILKLASYIGNKFEINILAIIAELSIREVALTLHDAIAAGFILPLNDSYKAIELDAITDNLELTTKQVTYKFVHDRIQQAAYSLIQETDKAATHLKIGRLLLKSIPVAEREDNIFDLVNQFNKASKLISDRQEKKELAQLNLIACRKARKSAAYSSGLEYAKLGLSWLGENAWVREYELALALHDLGAELASLSGDLGTMEEFINVVLNKARSLPEKIHVFRISILSKVSQKQLAEAITISQEILQQFCIIFPETPTPSDIQKLTQEIQQIIDKRKIEDLVCLPVMEDKEKLGIVQIVSCMIPALQLTGSPLFPLMVLLAVKLSIQYGNTLASAFVYAGYGILACGILQDVSTGISFGNLALGVASKPEFKASKPEVTSAVGFFVLHHQSHIKNTLPLVREGYDKGLELGSLEYVGYNAVGLAFNAFFCGQSLITLKEETKSYCYVLEQINQFTTANWCKVNWQQTANLVGDAEIPTILSGEAFQESEFISSMMEANDLFALYFLYLAKLILCYLFEEIELAQDWLINTEQYLRAGAGTVGEPAFYFYCCLVNLSALKLSSEQQAKTLEQIEQKQKLLLKWAKSAPMNHQHKYLLVEAEKHRVLGNYLDAIDCYDKAIKLASDNEFINEEALAYELAAKFYLARENNLIASVYMKQARYCYLKWGAIAIVEHLDNQYPELLATVTEEQNTNNIVTTSSSTKAETLDLETLIRTSQALAQIDDFSQLLETLIKFVLENAGAEKGYLILVQSDNLIIQASGTTEEIVTLQALPLDNCQFISKTIINYVYRTQESVVLDNAVNEGLFINDYYIKENQIKSVLCLPILNQGRIISILYLENNLAENSFTANRLEVLKLISSQAAISIENALLRQQETEQIFEYQVGGCLTINSPTYVVRQADIDLYQSLKQGHYCYVLNSRHMGKSSLRVRITNKLQLEGIICAFVDLTSIGSKNISPEQWYAGVIYSLVNNLKLGSKFNFRQWWRGLDLLSPAQKFSEFIREILLREIRGKIIIFIDEIDSVLGLKFNLDDFFAAIRACYNYRSEEKDYQRISFVFLGVASPASLVIDKNCTPFNIGRAIVLNSFQLHEVKPLVRGLATKSNNPQVLIERVLYWTGGQPFLTQKICNLMVEEKEKIAEGQEIEWVDNLIQSKIIEDWKSYDDPQHLQTISDRLTKSNSAKELLELYKEILDKGEIKSDYSDEQKELLLTGLVKQDKGKLRVYNRIYQSVFNLNWCNIALS